MMMRVLVVDDEPPARKKLRRLLAAHADVEVLGEASSGAEALAALAENRPDLVFLDVQMPDMDGFEVLRRVGSPVSFRPVFVTAYDEFAVRAFEVNALDYLLKPVDARRFDVMLERARKAIADGPKQRFPERLLVTDRDRSYYVATSTIDWLEADRNYVVIHAGGVEHVVRGTLESFTSVLDPDRFVRISRSHVVHVAAVIENARLGHGERRLTLRDGAALTWTRRYRARG
jgi:two-component system LytT family response regulator